MTAHDVTQRSPEWYELRRGMPTASRFDSILTPAKGEPSKAQDTLIAELIEEAMLPAQDGVITYLSPEMEQGIILEAEARCRYELDHGTVTSVGFLTSQCGRYGCSPDGLVGTDGGLELKCPALRTHIAWMLKGGLPNEHKVQVHGSMVVSRRRWWDFFSYSRYADPLHVHVEWDSFTDRLETELNNFAERLNQARVRFGLKPLGVSNK